ncbi:hypothetical protein WOLCODRAFT_158667 [Wolfiporia cocos MD-104 SS10]|uniref:Uncharacterized protein n=1 Tax=Wolfiporia cocos (strain MD-104) TaxID=742152 RepID=A0A2H3JC28_WOLCO|nr:hypothetical protein WOLCODRAFT_158667 [Wolfiporia cocos MD-104 SS10]
MRPDLPCQGSARVSASKREVTQHLPGRRPCNQPRTAAPPALPTAPLDWTTPSCTLPRVPARKGGPTRGGSPLRPRPSSGQRRKHLGSQHNGAHRPPWTKTRQPTGRVCTQRARRHHPPQQLGPPVLLRANNQAPPSTSRPKGKPCPRTYRARGSLCDGKDASSPPGAAGHPSPYAHPAGLLRQRQGHPGQRYRTSGRPYGKGNHPSHTTQPQATAIDPPAYQTQGRAKAHNRPGNPPHTESNGSAACLNNRATPSAGRAKQGAQQARRKAARTNGNDQAPRTGQSPPSKAYQRHRQDYQQAPAPGATTKGAPAPVY